MISETPCVDTLKIFLKQYLTDSSSFISLWGVKRHHKSSATNLLKSLGAAAVGNDMSSSSIQDALIFAVKDTKVNPEGDFGTLLGVFFTCFPPQNPDRLVTDCINHLVTQLAETITKQAKGTLGGKEDIDQIARDLIRGLKLALDTLREGEQRLFER